MNYCVRFFTAISQKTIELPKLSSMFNLTLRHFGNKFNSGNSGDSGNTEDSGDTEDWKYDVNEINDGKYDDEYHTSMSIAHSFYDASNSTSYINTPIPNLTKLNITNSIFVISPMLQQCWDRKPKFESQVNSEYREYFSAEEDEYFSKMSSEFAFKN